MTERDLDPYVMYLVVRTSLKMSVGKVAAQVGHAVQMLMQEFDMSHSLQRFKYREATQHWLHDDFPSYAKIVLAANDEEFVQVREENSDVFAVIDRGFSEVPANTSTVIGLWPCRKSEASETVKKLKLLR